MIYANRYNYRELLDQALTEDTREARLELFRWFSCFGDSFWNGEFYDASLSEEGYKDLRLYPVYYETCDGDVILQDVRFSPNE